MRRLGDVIRLGEGAADVGDLDVGIGQDVGNSDALPVSGDEILGALVEYGGTEEIFTNPRVQRTKDYITGRYG